MGPFWSGIFLCVLCLFQGRLPEREKAAAVQGPHETAWGKAVLGAQIGLRSLEGKRRFSTGSLCALEVSLRNSGKKPLIVLYENPQETGVSHFKVTKDQARLVLEAGEDKWNLASPLTKTLKPGETLKLRELRFGVYARPHSTPELALPQVILAPGAYAFSHRMPIRVKQNGAFQKIAFLSGSLSLTFRKTTQDD